MRKIFAIPILLCAVVACRHTELDDKFRELDSVIAERASYQKQFNLAMEKLKHQADSVPGDREKWYIYNLIALDYLTYDIDSAYIYIRKMNQIRDLTPRRELLNKKHLAIYNVRKCLFKEADQIISSIDTAGFTDRMKTDWYYLLNSYYRGKEENGIDPPYPGYYDEMILANYRSLYTLDCHNDEILYFIKGNILALEGKPEEAIDTIKKSYALAEDAHRRSYCSYEIARQYYKTGDRTQYKYWLAEASINDLKAPVKAYLSLYDLTMALYEEKENDKASKYIRIVADDATMLNYPSRINKSLKMQDAIFAAAEYEYKTRHRLSVIVTLGLTALLLIILVLLGLNFMQVKKLNQAYNKIFELNKIKDSFLFNYMVLAVEYLGRVEVFRHDMRVAYKSSGTEAVINLIRKPMSHSEEYDKLYRTFDETFLGIYPDFVEKVNELLIPENRMALNSDGTMPTELRILAALRLGFSKSGQIAKFLNCSLNTVYSYRYNMRHWAVTGPDEFEKRVMDIC